MARDGGPPAEIFAALLGSPRCGDCGLDYFCEQCHSPLGSVAFAVGQRVELKRDGSVGTVADVNGDASTIELRFSNGQSESVVAAALRAPRECAGQHARAKACGLCAPPRDLVRRRLESPSASLSAEDSLRLVTACITLGAHKAKVAQGQEAVMIIGNTGNIPMSFHSFHPPECTSFL